MPGSASKLHVVQATEHAEARELSVEEAFRKYCPYVAAIGVRLLGRHDEVDDLVQDVFLEAQRGLSKLRNPRAIKGWLATVTVRLAQRRLTRRRWASLLGFETAVDYEAVVSPGASSEDKVLVVRIYETLNDLPVKQRMAWSLRHLQGEPLARVAELCGCSLAAAKRRIAAAQIAIQEVLGDE